MLPDWLNAEIWAAFCEVRRQMGKRAPFTDYAKKLILRDLEAIRQHGYDPNYSLEVSIARGWRGVFPQGEQKLIDKWGREYYITPEHTRAYKQ